MTPAIEIQGQCPAGRAEAAERDGYDHPLRAHLQFAVPLILLEMQATGGPTEEDWSEMRRFGYEFGRHGGDNLLFGGEGAGETAGRVAHAGAVLAHVPGGVTLFGDHYEVKT
jgi:hypothetical protein